MIYLLFTFLSVLFIFNTPLYHVVILYIKKKKILVRIIAIFGDSLYMIGGGIVASVVMNIGLSNFTLLNLLNNYGTIMILVGATIREFFGKIKDK